MIDKMSDARAAADPAYAARVLRVDMMLELVPLRRKSGLTQEDMAARMGISRSQVGAMESRPNVASLDRIALYATVLGAKVQLVLPEPTA